MPAAVAQAQVTAFASTTPLSTGAFGTAPSASNKVLTMVDSDTTMTSGPASSTLRASFVSNQGVYLYDDSTTTTTRTVTPNGASPTAVMAVEISGTSGFDKVSTVASTQGSVGQTTRTCSTITTAAGSGALVFAFAAFHGVGATISGTPTWDNGFTHLGVVGTGAAGGTNPYLAVATKLVAASTAVGVTTCTLAAGSAQNTAGFHIAYASSAPTGGAAPQPVVGTSVAAVRAATW